MIPIRTHVTHDPSMIPVISMLLMLEHYAYKLDVFVRKPWDNVYIYIAEQLKVPYAVCHMPYAICHMRIECVKWISG
jgi:hypothetical protein